MKRSLIVALVIYLCLPVFSETIGEEFIKGDMFIRQMGMGGAGTGVADDMSATFYNPAGLAKSNVSGLSFGTIDTNKELMDENHYYSYNFAGFYYLGYDKKAADHNVKADTFSFARQSTMGLSYGITFKNINLETPTVSHRGYSTDLGLLLNVTPDLTIGLMGQDMISDKELDIQSTTRVGMGWKPFRDWLLIAADTEIGRTGAGDFTRYGFEAVLTEGLSVSTGINRGHSTFGLTLNFPIVSVSYAALLDSDSSTGTIHMIGAQMGIAQENNRPLSIFHPKEFALIEIGGNLIGGVGDFSIFGGGNVGADTVVANIKTAVKDPYIDGIMLKIRGFDGGLGSFGIVQEIRGELLKAKAKGKKIVAYMEEGCLGDEYYLASVADKVVAPASSSVGGLGKSISVIRIKDMLKNFGIEMEVLSKGKYKTELSMFSDNFTREQKHVMQGLVSDLYRQMINDIAASRKDKISIKELKVAADGSIYSAKHAKDLGLIDEVGYYQDALTAGKDLFGSKDDIEIVEIKDLIKAPDNDFLFGMSSKVAVIEIDGDIVTGKSGSNIILGGHTTGSDTITEQIRKATDDWQVKAIIVRINSGGGSAVASGQIYSEIIKARAKGKTVIASMGDVAASGGYYIAAACDKIVADPGTITGSIGVIGAQHLVLSGLFDKLGIKTETIKEGKHADMLSSFRKLSTEEARLLSGYIDDTYWEFIKAVADGRKMTTTEVAPLAEGRIYTGAQALDVKLIDKLGNFSDAVDLACDTVKIQKDPTLIYYRETDPFFNFGQNTVKMFGLGDGIWPGRRGGLAEYKLDI